MMKHDGAGWARKGGWRVTPSPLSKTLHGKYRPDIDGLRALAVISVVVFHAFPGLLPGGFVGVDIFFVISGFLITGLITEGLARADFSIVDFYKRRILRIFPALALVLACSLIAALTLLKFDQQKQIATHVAGGAGFVSNFILWNESGYFDTAAESKPLLHLWSLAIEEQFYLLWPPLLWAAWRWGAPFRPVVIAVAAVSLACNLLVFRTDGVADFYSPQTRFWELLAGALLACSPPRRDAAPSNDVLSLAGASAILASLVVIGGNRAFPGLWAVLPVGGAVAIIAAGREGWFNRVVLSHPLAVWVGLISFPLYLWHWPLLSFARLLEGATPGAGLRIVAVGAAFGLAFLTYRFIERPLRFGDRKGAKAVALVLAMAIVGAAGLAAAFLRKNPAPVSATEAALQWTDDDKFDPICRKRFGRGAPYCRMGEDRDPTVALIGDSFANAYFPGLSREYAARGDTLLMLGAAGCPPLLDVTSGHPGQKDSCRGRTSDAIRAVAREKSIHTVILAANWSLYVTGSRLRYPAPWEIQPVRGAAGSRREIFERTLGDAIDLLQQAGKKVVLLKQTPELSFDAAPCVTDRASTTKCEMRTDDAKAFLAPYEKVFDAFVAKRSGLEIVDPVPALCPDADCIIMDQGLPIYRDDMHLSRHGSEYMAHRLSLFAAPR